MFNDISEPSTKFVFKVQKLMISYTIKLNSVGSNIITLYWDYLTCLTTQWFHQIYWTSPVKECIISILKFAIIAILWYGIYDMWNSISVKWLPRLCWHIRTLLSLFSEIVMNNTTGRSLVDISRRLQKTSKEQAQRR